MSNLSVLSKQDRSRLVDLPDQYLFFLFFALGALSIWALKLLGFHQLVATAVPVGLMVVYAALALITKRYRIREDKVGDNIYYLGFLYTLTSLSYALYVFNPNGAGATDIITNFGIAIFTTIFGLAGRVFFNQMREDPLEYEREARYSLAQATSELRAHLADICIEMSSFKRKAIQVMDEGVSDITAATRATLSENVERFATTSADVIDKIQAAFSSFTDHSTQLNGIASKNVEALQALFERIEKIEASPELLASKIEPIIQKFSQVADEATQRNRAQSADLKRVRDAIAAAMKVTESLNNAMEKSTQDVATKIDSFGKVLDGSVGAVERLTDTMKSATSGLVGELEAGRQAAAMLGTGIDTHKTVIAEIRAAIEADLRIAQQHRDATAKMLQESRTAVAEVERSLVSLSRTLVEQLGGH